MHLLARQPLREAVQHAGALAQRVDDAVADGQVVPHQVELGRPGPGEVDPIRVRDAYPMGADVEFHRRGRRLTGHLCDPSAPAGRCGRRPVPSRARGWYACGMSEAAHVTVTLDPQVAAWARAAAERQDRSLSEVVNAALRTAFVRDSLSELPVDEEAEQAAARADVDIAEQAAADARRRSRGAA